MKGDFYSFPAANLGSLENRSNPQGELSEKSFNNWQEWLISFHVPLISAETLHGIRPFEFQDKRWNFRGCEVWKYLWNTVNSWPQFIPGYSLSLRLFVLIRQSWEVNNEHMQIKAFTMPGWIVLSWKCGRLYTDSAPPGEKNLLTTKRLPHTHTINLFPLALFQFSSSGLQVLQFKDF